MLLLASSSPSLSLSLSLPSVSHLHYPLPSSFPCPSLHLRFPSQATPLRLHTPPPLSCSLNSSSSVEQSSSLSQMQNSLLYSRAYWVTEFLIAWNVDVANEFSCQLIASKNASLTIANGQIQGEDLKVELQEDRAGLSANVLEKFPHIRGYKAFKLPSTLDVKPLLKSQLAVAIYDSDDKCRNCTGLQLPGVLDELFSYNGPLGALFSEEAVSLYLWAPTAQAVRAYIYKDPSGDDPIEIVCLEEENGVWRTKGPKSWEHCYYVYEVCVYHHSTLRVEKCHANDPYARGVSSDGRRTFLLNLDSDELKPDGWDDLADEKPTIHCFTDISVYEMHIRDFSATDLSVQPAFRGGYLAFTLQDSAGVLHLKRLSSAGITHVHLLPTFQFAGVDDQKENWRFVDTSIMESFPPDSDQQQALITAIQNFDGYNWGYNPVLWGVPKGSYASNPNGPYRTIEFRKMVKALNHIGLRVVLDVVYNHLQGSGPFDQHSVLDKIVPGYYLRRNRDGFIENSTCINNTASEHFMVERLILDDLVHWALNYKIDGFRFDLMGHIMKRTMVQAKTALHCLTKEKDGVDGSSIYIYGEGWDFGEVAKNGRGINASQFNLPGTQIGSFNDRIRDAILGGSPFGDPLQQGFVTGLLLQPNDHDHGTEENAKSMLAASMDHIQIGMAANLQDFVLTNCKGEEVKGSEILTYDGTPVAYASCPTETINYVSAHDNETLFDIVSLKTPVDISVTERCRINHLATSIVALSQGIPFFHCGDEILRSKSLDRDSYNSGDWFNRLDFTYNSNNWGVGLPPQEKNEKNWPLIKPRLANPSFKPQKIDILATVDNFLNLLRIRYSSPLFRLKTANAIQQRVSFHNTGPSWVCGVIVMSIEDGHDGFPGLSQLDPIYSFIVVVINASPKEASFVSPALQSRSLQLHPIQVSSSDEVVKCSRYEASSGCFVVPQRTTAVFVEPRKT
ncbi:pullulanase 1, chloroplastic isoform X1 [Vigna radiata var. radiata]|uniref:Pullulanase 1, chloroplastic isoform X1 n=1 Tax=Vigna radiata var. radiata TaxID=3916 RepID=A0A1S3V5U9_VIGRR|nr:pullulanase 1, chloroplastic isoform X1 [Vigna radiata var. radiata]